MEKSSILEIRTNEASIRELAEMLLEKFNQHPERSKFPPFAGFQEIESGSYYGAGYQDVQYRRPSIKNAKKYLKWSPKIEMKQSVEQTLNFFIKESMSASESLDEQQLKQKGHHKIISVSYAEEKREPGLQKELLKIREIVINTD